MLLGLIDSSTFEYHELASKGVLASPFRLPIFGVMCFWVSALKDETPMMGAATDGVRLLVVLLLIVFLLRGVRRGNRVLARPRRPYLAVGRRVYLRRA